MINKKRSNLTESEVDYADAAASEYEGQGHTDKKCPRCGGVLLIDIVGNSYAVICSNGDFKVTSRGI